MTVARCYGVGITSEKAYRSVARVIARGEQRRGLEVLAVDDAHEVSAPAA